MTENVAKRIGDRGPDEVVDVLVAAEFLGLSRATLYRSEDLERVRRGPGLVGYKVADLLAYKARIGGDGDSDFFSNVFVPAGETVQSQELRCLRPSTNTIVRRRLPGLTAGSLTIELPRALEWAKFHAEDLVVIDMDGLNEKSHIILIAQEGEHINGKPQLRFIRADGALRLRPLCGAPDVIADGWWVD